MYRMCGYFTYVPLYNEQCVQAVEAFSDTSPSGESVRASFFGTFRHVIPKQTEKVTVAIFSYYGGAYNLIEEYFILKLKVSESEENFVTKFCKSSSQI